MPIGVHCHDASHQKCPARGRCLTCVRAQSRRAYHRRVHGREPDATALVPAGLSVMQVAAYRAWATKRARYGGRGVTAETSAKYRENMRRQLAKGHYLQRRTHCKYGHPWTAANTKVRRDGSRACRTCLGMRHRGRPSWVTVDGCRISIVAHDRFFFRRLAALRAALIASHPDKGGTSARFIAAQRRLQRFLAQERDWYAPYGLAPPPRAAHRQPASKENAA